MERLPASVDYTKITPIIKKRLIIIGLVLIVGLLVIFIKVYLFTPLDKGMLWKQRNVEYEKEHPKFKYGPNISTLKGVIQRQTFWGPPNYGEDTTVDKKEIYLVLFLDDYIHISADTSNEFNPAKNNINKLQLLASVKLDSLVDEKVVVKGMLFGAQTGHHHTDVLLSVTEINASR